MLKRPIVTGAAGIQLILTSDNPRSENPELILNDRKWFESGRKRYDTFNH